MTASRSSVTGRSSGSIGSVGAVGLGFALLYMRPALTARTGAPADVTRLTTEAGLSVDPASLDAKGVADYAGKAHALTFSGFVLDAIPETMVGAFTGGNILQVLFVAIPFGIALSLIGEAGAPALRVLQSLSDAVFRLTGIFMAAASS